MQLGMIGLGRMGASMVRRLIRGGHECIVHDLSAEAMAASGKDGATSFAELKGICRRTPGASRNLDHGAGRCCRQEHRIARSNARKG